MRGCILILLLLSQVAQAQTAVSTPLALTGVTDSRQIGDLVLVGEKSTPTLSPVLLVELSTVARFKRSVTVWDSDNKVVPLKMVSDPALSDETIVPKDQPLYSAYICTQEGTFRVRTLCFDFDAKVFEEFEDTFTVGPPPAPPKPPKPPAPPVPEDAFGNIGQRVAEWSAGLSANVAVGAAYKTAAVRLQTDPLQSIDTASALLSADLLAIPGYAAYSNVTANINADLRSRWPLSRGVLADYYLAVAAGFGGAK